MNTPKKLILGLALFLGLSLAALTGLHVPAPFASTAAGVPVAHADGCDGVPPPPGVDCGVTPTPTPKP